MPLTEAKKRANAKYQAKTIASLACRVKKEQAEAFKAYCESAGKTSNAALKDFVLECIGELETVSRAVEAPTAHGSIGGILHPEAIKTAQEAAQSVGETVPQFIERAVETQAKRDRSSLALGINPVTGEKLDKEG